MSLTIRDCLKMPSLSLGRVIAGRNGLDNIVNTISVVEFDNFDDRLYTPNELLITAFYSVKDNVAAQCHSIEEYKKSGDVGMVLFYTESVLKNVSPQVMETADRLNFPIIALPGENMGIRYSDVISDVMEAVFIDRKNNDYFVNNTMERISQMAETNRNITTVLSFAAAYAKASFFLCDDKNNIIATAYWPFTNKINPEVIFKAGEGDTEYNVYKMPFTSKSDTKLTLYGAGKSSRLNTRIMNEVIEVVRLFAVIWNYNLNISTRESLIPALLEGDTALAESIAGEQNIHIHSFNSVMFVDVDIEDSKRSVKHEIIRAIRELFAVGSINGIVDLFGNLIVVIMPCLKKSTRDIIIRDDIREYLDKIEETVSYTGFTRTNVAGGIKNIYLKYCGSIDTVKKIYPSKHSFTQSEINFADKCNKVVNSIDNEKEIYMNILRPIIEDPEEELLLTLSTYLLDADSEVKKTAELLFVHRNTVQYRLTKIKDLIGLDFSKMPVMYEVYFATAVLRAVG